MSTKRGKRTKEKRSGHENNYMSKTGKAIENWLDWLRKECLKRTTEALIMAAQK